MVWEGIGYLGGFLIAISLVPQLIKMYRTKSAKDISLLWTFVALVGLMLYGAYAYMDDVIVLLTFAIIESILFIIIILMKIKY